MGQREDRSALRALVLDAGAGDTGAFAELVRRHQEMAFGHALGILGDFHLAQDAAQEAFVSAYVGLDGLREPERFPGWLRGIVRHQCHRILRRRAVPTVSLDGDGEPPIADRERGPDATVEDRAGVAAVLAAIRALPEPLREVAIPYYLQDRSQREVAAFLEIPPTTVNNRLHAARKTLRGGLLTMAKETLRTNGLPEDFAQTVGEIIGARGPVMEARFAPEAVPRLLSALTAADTTADGAGEYGVVEHLGDGRVRCIALSSEAALQPGTSVRGDEVPVRGAASVGAIRELVAGVADRPSPPRPLETGIKVIDLLCPLPAGGAVGFIGPTGVGKVVMAAELVHRLHGGEENLTVFVPTLQGYDVRFLWEGFGGDNPPYTSDKVRSVFVPAPKEPPDELAALFDAALYFSFDAALAGIYPAVDTLRSRSRLLTPEVVGREHYEVARGVRALLWRAEEIEGRSYGAEDLADEERETLGRARRLRRFLSQPMYVAEPWTGRRGERVSRDRTVRDCAALLRGERGDLPEDALYMVGTLEQAAAKANGPR